jgi:DNA-binding Xre family transcriptional regulator
MAPGTARSLLWKHPTRRGWSTTRTLSEHALARRAARGAWLCLSASLVLQISMYVREIAAENAIGPRTGGVYLRVAALCRERGIVSTRGRTPGRPSIRGLIERTGLAPKQAQAILRRPWALEHISFRTIDQLCRGLECEPGELLGWDGLLPGRQKVHAVPANSPPVRDRQQRWNEQWEREHPPAAAGERAPAATAGAPGLPDSADEPEEAEYDEYVRPGDLYWLGDAAPITRIPVLREPAVWDSDAAGPLPEPQPPGTPADRVRGENLAGGRRPPPARSQPDWPPAEPESDPRAYRQVGLAESI